MAEMLEQIRSMGEQFRWAAELEPPHIGTHSEVLVVGMGGSGVAGDYLAALAAPIGTRVEVHKGYGPVPGWAIRQRPLVIAASYSGNTEETLDFTVSAWESGLPVATLSTGGALAQLTDDHGWPSIRLPSGMQPRAAIGHMVGGALKLMEAANAVEDQRLSFVETIELAEREVADGSESMALAADVAERLQRRIPIVYGGGPVSSTVAFRWKTQINENAKVPAWNSSLPELNHNEITGWESLPDITSEHLGVVMLRDESDHDRVSKRADFTRRLTESAVPWVAEIESRGRSTLARLVSLTIVGDLVSTLLADRLGVDPVPVATIEELKKLLAEE